MSNENEWIIVQWGKDYENDMLPPAKTTRLQFIKQQP